VVTGAITIKARDARGEMRAHALCFIDLDHFKAMATARGR
jgi:GGDEF domain-containing protein